jgi:hypothetical protein
MSNTLEEYIAYQVFFDMQVGIKKTHLGRSILVTARQFPRLNDLHFTEMYFVEEMMFAVALALEAEIRFKFMRWMIDAWNKEHDHSEEVALADVYRGMKLICYPVSCERMRLAGLEPTSLHNASDVEDRLYARFSEYENLVNASIECDYEIELRPWSGGFVRRDHPMEQTSSPRGSGGLTAAARSGMVNKP